MRIEMQSYWRIKVVVVVVVEGASPTLNAKHSSGLTFDHSSKLLLRNFKSSFRFHFSARLLFGQHIAHSTLHFPCRSLATFVSHVSSIAWCFRDYVLSVLQCLVFRVLYILYFVCCMQLGHGSNASAYGILTFFLNIDAVLQLRGALLAPEQLLFRLAARQVRSAVSMGIQFADAAPQSLPGVACNSRWGWVNFYTIK